MVPCERYALQRREITVDTHLGPVRCKIAVLNGKVLNAKPEHDDCAALAQTNGIPLAEVCRAARERLNLHTAQALDTTGLSL